MIGFMETGGKQKQGLMGGRVEEGWRGEIQGWEEGGRVDWKEWLKCRNRWRDGGNGGRLTGGWMEGWRDLVGDL